MIWQHMIQLHMTSYKIALHDVTVYETNKNAVKTKLGKHIYLFYARTVDVCSGVARSVEGSLLWCN